MKLLLLFSAPSALKTAKSFFYKPANGGLVKKRF
jgi:hypothetical protein